MREVRAVMSELAASGLSPDQLALVMELAAVVAAEARPVQDDQAQRRREKDAERHRVRRHLRKSADSADTRVSPTPPSEKTPFPPLKGGTSPVETQPIAKPLPAEPVRSLAVWVSEIWEITPRPGRERSGRRDLENALKAAQRRGEDLAKVKLGLVGYFGSEDATKAAGQFCKGVHVVISSGRWEAFVGAGNTDPPEPDDPWRERMLRWSMNQYWNSEWGPKPGKPGCLAPKDLLDRAA